MTAIAEGLDRRLRTLDAQRASCCGQLVRDLLALFTLIGGTVLACFLAVVLLGAIILRDPDTD